ncbi:MAG: hypothetical protein ACRDP7_02340 [Trebonia sp.]
MTVEDQLRAAGRAVSEQVRDLPRLDLCTQPGTRRAKARASRRWPGASGWLIPVAAAAAVVAVAATLVAVKSPPRAADKTSAGPAASRSTASAAAPAPADPEALPGYFVSLRDLQITGPLPPAGQSGIAKEPRPDSVTVGETLTGKRLATITPPTGSTFVGVTGAADDRTFVLDSVQIAAGRGFLQPTQERTWYLLRIRPGAIPVTTLTRLSFPVPTAADVSGIALSPDGTKLALFYQVAGKGTAFPYSGPFTLGIYSVATGTVLRSWTGANPSHGSLAYGSNDLPDSNSLLTWASNGQRLAFVYRLSTGADSSLYLREVDTAGPGGDLLADSTVAAKIAVSTTNGKSKIWCDSLGITDDGRSAICGAELPETAPVGATLDALTEPAPWIGCASPTDPVYPGLVEISLTDDRLARVLYEFKPKCMGAGNATVLWSSPSGDTVLGAVNYTDDPSMTEHGAVVLYRHGTATTINWPGAVSTLLANQTAF